MSEKTVVTAERQISLDGKHWTMLTRSDHKKGIFTLSHLYMPGDIFPFHRHVITYEDGSIEIKNIISERYENKET